MLLESFQLCLAVLALRQRKRREGKKKRKVRQAPREEKASR